MATAAKAQEESHDLYIVGVGTSAGGIDGLSKMLGSFNGSISNLCVVIAQHLSPSHKSELSAILARHCSWPVITIEEVMEVKPCNIYVTPENKQVIYAKRHLQLADLEPRYAYAPSIDELFISLAENEWQYAIGVILSGTARDGAKGLEVIKNRGGFTIAQSPDSAQYADMPNAAIQTGMVDVVSHPAKIFYEIASYIKNHDVVKSNEPSKKSVDVIFDPFGKAFGYRFFPV